MGVHNVRARGTGLSQTQGEDSDWCEQPKEVGEKIVQGGDKIQVTGMEEWGLMEKR